MKQKLFLTSAIAIGVIAPAVAETFPSNGLMQENKTYENAANETNMDGVYEGSVNATAQYDVIDYILSAGQYLPKDSDTQTTCPAGSFCAGGSVQYDEENDQGIQSCPIIDTAQFTSDEGSGAVTACYQENSAMSSAELNPFETAHLNTSKNTDGYINGVKYANATTTARRYATSATAAGDWAALDESDLAITDLACENGYHYKPGLNLADTIGNTAGESRAYIKNTGLFIEHDARYGATHYGLTNNNTWAVDYGDKGMLVGQARCSKVNGVGVFNGGAITSSSSDVTTHTTAELGAEGGQYCYCNVTGYTPDGGILQSLSSPWVFEFVHDYAENCADSCTNVCALYMHYTYWSALVFRAAVFGSLGTWPTMCEATNYMLSAGQYLPADSETVTTCPTGSYCSGIGNVNYNENSAQGIESCPTGYTLSADGATSANECYRTCTTSDVAHSATVTGEYYYGDNNQCKPTACVNGYHYKAETTGPNLTSLIGITEAGEGYTSNDSTGSDYATDNMDNTIIANDPLAFAVDYGDKGIIKGYGRCSTRNVANQWIFQDGFIFESDHFVSSLTDETGKDGAQYCYCQLDSYTPVSGSATALSAPWVFFYDIAIADRCAYFCASFCAVGLRNDNPDFLAFRAAVFGSLGASPAMCEANTITINWTDVDPEYAGQNDEGTATYGGDIRTPVKAETKPGKRFLGWIFSKPEQTPLPE